MGKMTRTNRAKLKRLEARRAELSAELEAIGDEEEAVIAKTVTHLKIDTDGPFRGLHLDDTGGVHALYCMCAPCQAKLNNVTVVAATEFMIERGLIHHEHAHDRLNQAEELDRKHGVPYVN
jgi:hypothetical protein